MKFAGPYAPVSLKERIVPRKKGTFAKVTAVVTGVSETVKNVGEIVEGIAGTVSEVAQTIRQKEATLPQKGEIPRQNKVVQKPPTGRDCPCRAATQNREGIHWHKGTREPQKDHDTVSSHPERMSNMATRPLSWATTGRS
jgi:hypothetical protein